MGETECTGLFEGAVERVVWGARATRREYVGTYRIVPEQDVLENVP